MRFAVNCAIALIVPFVCGCSANSYADRATAVGGITGAVAGTMIGADSGNAGTGAVIGTMAGMAAGNMIGQDIDEAEARSHEYYSKAYAEAQMNAVTLDEVIQMTESGVSDEIIIAKIEQDGPSQRLSTDDIIELTKRGISSAVIKVYQTQRPRELPPSRRTSRDPIIIERHFHQVPQPYTAPGAAIHYQHRFPSGRSQWGISVGH